MNEKVTKNPSRTMKNAGGNNNPADETTMSRPPTVAYDGLLSGGEKEDDNSKTTETVLVDRFNGRNEVGNSISNQQEITHDDNSNINNITICTSPGSPSCTETIQKQITKDDNEKQLQMKKPIKPPNSYIIFYQMERCRLLSDSNEIVRLPSSGYYSLENVKQFRRQYIIQNSKPQPRRKHRKTHGKYAFTELSGVIAANWNVLNPSVRSIFDKQAKIEADNYFKAKKEWNDWNDSREVANKNNTSASSTSTASALEIPGTSTQLESGNTNTARTEKAIILKCYPTDSPQHGEKAKYEETLQQQQQVQGYHTHASTLNFEVTSKVDTVVDGCNGQNNMVEKTSDQQETHYKNLNVETTKTSGITTKKIRNQQETHSKNMNINTSKPSGITTKKIHKKHTKVMMKERLKEKPIDNKKSIKPPNAYVIFFQMERVRLLSDNESIVSSKQNYSPENIKEFIKQYALKKTKPQPRRIHRKTHGKYAFTELSRLISRRWKCLDTSIKSMFFEQAKVESARYQKAKREWMKRNDSREKVDKEKENTSTSSTALSLGIQSTSNTQLESDSSTNTAPTEKAIVLEYYPTDSHQHDEIKLNEGQHSSSKSQNGDIPTFIIVNKRYYYGHYQTSSFVGQNIKKEINHDSTYRNLNRTTESRLSNIEPEQPVSQNIDDLSYSTSVDLHYDVNIPVAVETKSSSLLNEQSTFNNNLFEDNTAATNQKNETTTVAACLLSQNSSDDDKSSPLAEVKEIITQNSHLFDL